MAGVDGFFAVIGFPHADDAASLAARCPNQHNQTGIQVAYGNESMFFVHVTPVLSGEMKTSEDFIGPSKVQASFIQSFVSFEFVELKVHELLYPHKYFQDFIYPKQY